MLRESDGPVLRTLHGRVRPQPSSRESRDAFATHRSKAHAANRVSSDRMPAKRYFEFSEGSSNKFWEVWCDGAEVFTRYGKIGASGQLTVKDLKSKDAAKQAHDKLVKEKTGKGYVEKGAKKPAAKSAAKSAEKSAEPSAPVRVEVPENGYRLECVEGTSSKFYQVHVDGKNLVITYGKIGTEGKTEKKKVKEEWAAKWEM